MPWNADNTVRVVLATTSVAVTRVMLNIRSVTVDEGVEWIVSVYITPGSSLDIHKALPDSEKLCRIDRKFRVELWTPLILQPLLFFSCSLVAPCLYVSRLSRYSISLSWENFGFPSCIPYLPNYTFNYQRMWTRLKEPHHFWASGQNHFSKFFRRCSKLWGFTMKSLSVTYLRYLRVSV